VINCIKRRPPVGSTAQRAQHDDKLQKQRRSTSSVASTEPIQPWPAFENKCFISYNSQWLDWYNKYNIANNTGENNSEIFLSSGWEQFKCLGMTQTVCH